MVKHTKNEGTPYIDEPPQGDEEIGTNVIQVAPNEEEPGRRVMNFWGTIIVKVRHGLTEDELHAVIDEVAALHDAINTTLA